MTVISTKPGSTDSTPWPNTPTASVNTSMEQLNTVEHPTSLWGLALQDRQAHVELDHAAELFASDDPEEKAIGEELANQLLHVTDHTGKRLFTRADQILEYCDMLEHVANYQKDRSDQLKYLAQKTTLKRDKFLQHVMKVLHEQRPDLKTIHLPTHEMRSKLNKSCEITDESLIPSEYMTTPEPKPPVPYPDKNLIKKTIQSGTEVAGAVVNEHRSWTSHKPKPKSKPQPTLKQQEPPQLSPATEEDEGW